MRSPILLLLALTLSWAGSVGAQPADVPQQLQPRYELVPYVGVARHSLVGTHLGVTPDRSHRLVGVHGVVNVWRSQRWTFGYARAYERAR